MPLTSIQMLGMNGVSHLIPPLMYAMQPLSDDAMQVPPRRRDSRLVAKSSLVWLILPWLLIWAATWSSLTAVTYQMHTGMVFTADIAASEERPGESMDISQATIERALADGAALSSAQVHHGSKVARTMNFVAVCVAELLLVLSCSSARPFSMLSLRNPYLVMASTVMGSLALAAVYLSEIEFIGNITGFVMLQPKELVISFGFAIGAILLLEIMKIGYRAEVQAINELRQYHSIAVSKGMLSADATDAQVLAFRADHPLEELKTMV